jgi:uncharacterized coiled-coil protein SlyX
VDAYIKLLKAHENLLLAAGVLLAALFLGNRWINRGADKAIADNAAAQKALEEAIESNKQLAAEAKQQAEIYDALVLKLTAQNDKLLDAIAQRNQATAAQQKLDQIMPLPDLAARWEKLANLLPTDIQNINGKLVVSDGGSRATVQMLEEIPNLRATIANQETIISNKDTQIAEQAKVTDALRSQVSGLNEQILKSSEACKMQVAEVQAKARRSKRNWFLRGLAAGAGIVVTLLMR